MAQDTAAARFLLLRAEEVRPLLLRQFQTFQRERQDAAQCQRARDSLLLTLHDNARKRPRRIDVQKNAPLLLDAQQIRFVDAIVLQLHVLRQKRRRKTHDGIRTRRRLVIAHDERRRIEIRNAHRMIRPANAPARRQKEHDKQTVPQKFMPQGQNASSKRSKPPCKVYRSL